MVHVLSIAQEVGGVGKTTITRGLAEAVLDVSILELEASHRLTEYGLVTEADAPGIRHFPMRASRAEIEATGGLAARAELDPVVDALYEITVPHLADIGANTAASFLDMIGEHAEGLRAADIQLGLLVVLTNDPASLASGAKLLHAAKDWAGASFAVVNELRGPVDRELLAPVAGKATLTILKRFEFEPATLSVLAGTQLRGIPALDRRALASDFGPAMALRVMRDLTAFRLAVMQPIKPAATWLIE